MKPLVSVIIPVYNVAKYIRECLESVLNQSYENLEVIVVDDGSADGSGEICDEIAAADARVKVFHKKNGGPGPSSARNFGLKKAKGEFLTFVDSDDVVRKGYVERMARVMKDNDIVICGYNDIVPEDRIMSGKTATEKLLVKQDNLEVVVWGKLYRREVFEGIMYPDGEKYEDSLTAYKVLNNARSVVYISESLYKYRKREGSIMSESEILERLKARQKAAKEAREYFKNDEELRTAADVAIFTAEFAYMDAAVRGEINKKYYAVAAEWIKKHKINYRNNKFMTKKLKIYIMLNNIGVYKAFRTIV